MRAAVTLVLALCGALTLRVRLVHCQLREHPDTDQHNSPCDQHPPSIRIEYYVPTLNQGLRSYYHPRFIYHTVYDSAKKLQNKATIPFETVVKVSCSTSTYTYIELITMTRDGKKLVWNGKHRNGIVWSPNLFKSEYVYECTDIETACKSSVIIAVGPRLEVISPNAQMDIDDFHTNYSIHYGESMTVLCSGPDATHLLMSQNGKAILTERKNDTTIKRVVNELDLRMLEYVCTDVNTTYNSSVIIKTTPKIYFQSGNEAITPYCTYLDNRDRFKLKYYFQYNYSIEVFCSGLRPVKFIGQQEDGTILLTENFNENTAFINITKLGTSEYTCNDSELSDYAKSVQVTVLPRVQVTSPNVRLIGIYRDVHAYTITYGHPLEIVCSGPGASRLAINQYQDITNSVEQIVNKSTVKFIINKVVWSEMVMFTCSEQGNQLGQVLIQVGVLPAVTDFLCVSYNLQFVNCTWTAINNKANTTLYYLHDGILTRICEKSRSSWRSKFCVLDYEYDYGWRNVRVLTFLIRSCLDFGCYNQTFHFNHLSVVKLAPPEGIKLLRATSRGAVLQWDMSRVDFTGQYLTSKRGELHQSVQYWYSGIEPRDVNSSLVTCDNKYCKIELNLPCAGQFYEVRIYQKLKEAIGEKYWSEPRSVTFYTDGEGDISDNIDPTCYQRPIKTKEVMKYFVQELRQDVRVKIQKMRQEIRALHDKLANIRKYLSNKEV